MLRLGVILAVILGLLWPTVPTTLAAAPFALPACCSAAACCSSSGECCPLCACDESPALCCCGPQDSTPALPARASDLSPLPLLAAADPGIEIRWPPASCVDARPRAPECRHAATFAGLRIHACLNVWTT